MHYCRLTAPPSLRRSAPFILQRPVNARHMRPCTGIKRSPHSWLTARCAGQVLAEAVLRIRASESPSCRSPVITPAESTTGLVRSMSAARSEPLGATGGRSGRGWGGGAEEEEPSPSHAWVSDDDAASPAGYAASPAGCAAHAASSPAMAGATQAGSTPNAGSSATATAQPDTGAGVWPGAAERSCTTLHEGPADACGEGLYTALRRASFGLAPAPRDGPGRATRAVCTCGVRIVLVGLRGAGAAVRRALLAPVVPSVAAMLAAALGPASSCAARPGERPGGTAARATWWCSVGECTATGRQLLFRLAQLRAVPVLGPAQWSGPGGDGRGETALLGGQGRARAALVAGWSGACMAGIDLALGAAGCAALTAHADAVAAGVDRAAAWHTDAVAAGLRCPSPILARGGSRCQCADPSIRVCRSIHPRVPMCRSIHPRLSMCRQGLAREAPSAREALSAREAPYDDMLG
jgi:hypothetical protein